MTYNVIIGASDNSSSMNNVDQFTLNGVFRNILYQLQHNEEYPDTVQLNVTRIV